LSSISPHVHELEEVVLVLFDAKEFVKVIRDWLVIVPWAARHGMRHELLGDLRLPQAPWKEQRLLYALEIHCTLVIVVHNLEEGRARHQEGRKQLLTQDVVWSDVVMWSVPEDFTSGLAAVGEGSRWTVFVVDHLSIPVTNRDVETTHDESIVYVLLLVDVLQPLVSPAKILGEVAPTHTPVYPLVHFVEVLLPNEVRLLRRTKILNRVLLWIQYWHVVPLIFSEVVVVRQVLFENGSRILVDHVCELEVYAIHAQKFLHSLGNAKVWNLSRVVRHMLLKEGVLDIAFLDHERLESLDRFEDKLVQVVEVQAVRETLLDLGVGEGLLS